jgi:HD-GYP domain-containing protein (c-di-GMP phosphodiesterase class II)
MRTPLTFAAFVRDGHYPVVEALAESWSSTVRVSSLDGELLWSSDRNEVSETTASTRTAPPNLEAPIEIRGTIAGRVEVVGGLPPALVTAVAAEFASRYTTEADLDELTLHLSQCYEELNLLYRLSRALNPDGDFASSCSALLRETADFLGARTVVLFLRSDSESFVDAAVAQHGRVHEEIATLLEEGERWQLEKLHTDLTEHLSPKNDGASHRHFGTLPGVERPVSFAVIPVYGRDRLAGFVGIFRRVGDGGVESGELRFIECLAAQLSSATTNRELRSELRGVLFNTVKSLVAAVDAKDAYTRGHSERVYLLSVLLGRHLGLNHEELQTLTWSSLLHDVGKIAMPLEILTKPTRLTDAEFEIIKTHPERGCMVIEPIPQLRSVLPGIRSHHERFDGRGYPDGLAGTDIPILARIIAVADTYDAMVSSRAYRQARSFEFAIEEIRTSSGTQLDPQIVKAFLDLVEQGVITPPEAAHALEDAA